MSSSRRPPAPDFMRQALTLARQSRPSPNPRVGAVIVRDGEVVGRGRHEAAGEPHAEVLAIAEAGDRARGADMYVTLEPCCHEGQTGPCTEAIAGAGLARVFVGMVDPDPRVSGKGLQCLEQSGHAVETGLLEAECLQLLEGYATQRTRGVPLVVLKAAVTLDGALASRSGDSKWISAERSRARGHALRAEADAVAVGIETVLTDDPRLTVRHAPGANPLRIVLDSRLRTPLDCRLIATADQAPLLIAHAGAEPPAIERYSGLAGVETLACAPDPAGRIDLRDLLARLGRRGVLSLLVEGGSRVHGAFAEAGLADRFALFVAPKLLGPGRPWLALSARERVDQALAVSDLRSTSVDDDLLIEGRFKPPVWERQ